MKNAINWFEIPVKNFNRAKSFYETILVAVMQSMEAMRMKSAFSLPTCKAAAEEAVSLKDMVTNPQIKVR